MLIAARPLVQAVSTCNSQATVIEPGLFVGVIGVGLFIWGGGARRMHLSWGKWDEHCGRMRKVPPRPWATGSEVRLVFGHRAALRGDKAEIVGRTVWCDKCGIGAAAPRRPVRPASRRSRPGGQRSRAGRRARGRLRRRVGRTRWSRLTPAGGEALRPADALPQPPHEHGIPNRWRASHVRSRRVCNG